MIIFALLFLEGIVHNYLLFYPFLLGIVLVLTYPKFKKKYVYWILVILSTILYDLLYANILLWNTFFYCLILSKILSYKKEVGLLEVTGFYLLYHFLSFSCLFILKVNINIFLYVQSILLSIPINLCFFGVINFILSKQKRKRTINY